MSPGIDLFGEVLFDGFPDGRRVLGGAPFNVAWHLAAWGEAPRLVSRVGQDEDGAAVLAAMQGWGMDTGAVSRDATLPTGRVDVTLADGEPEYEIVHPVAWDAIATPPPPCAAWLYHGSLALRDARSRETLEALACANGVRVFLDVNLRPPWWDPEEVGERVRAAHWVKLNEDELDRLAPPGNSLPDRARALLENAGLEGLVVTRGAAGAVVLGADDVAAAAPAPERVRVVDTVGAGDAFASVMILGLRRGWSPVVSLERALEFAAAVCGLRGATVADPAFYRPFLDAWGLPGEGDD